MRLLPIAPDPPARMIAFMERSFYSE